MDLEVGAGQVLGLLGPHGAGKTTTVRILTTLLEADSGRAVVAGHDVLLEPHAALCAIGSSMVIIPLAVARYRRFASR